MTNGPLNAVNVPAARSTVAANRFVNHREWRWLCLPLLAVMLYWFGLGSPYAPTNGDEMVYIHIARMTADSGHWLPLQSDIAAMRNTKPPLLLWQAIFAGDWGHNWSLWALRVPSVLYTLFTASLVGYFAYQFQHRLRTACIAVTLYLIDFSSFRYGRAYLTSAPETFWLALPMWWLLRERLRQPGAALRATGLTYTVFGIVMGLGAAYKSFALLAPAGAAWWCAALVGEPQRRWSRLWRLTVGTSWSVLLGLALFACWFWLDPNPEAVWQEFVIGENAGKMSNPQGYWHAALYGAYPMWTQLLAYPINAGLMALQTIGYVIWAAFQAFRHRALTRLTPAHRVLLVWLVVWLIVFTIPSQRSERYVIPAMPALAIAMALAWDRIPRLWSLGGLLLLAPALLILGRIAWFIGTLDLAPFGWTAAALAFAALGLVAVLSGWLRAAWTRNAGLLGCLSVYAVFACMVAPLSNGYNEFPEAVRNAMQHQRIAVPNGFTGQFESYHFTFPTARIAPYDAEGRNTGERYPELPPEQRLPRLLTEFDAVVWRDETGHAAQPTCLPNCRVIAERWHVRSRHKSDEVTLDNLWYPDQWLFNREWLLTAH